jgi:hypothetical protein
MAKAEVTDWMSAKQFVEYLDDNKIQSPMYAWKLIELLRMHSAKKFVMEQGHPIPRPSHFTPASLKRPIIRYTFRKQVKDSIVGGVCLFQVTKKTLSGPRERDTPKRRGPAGGPGVGHS